MAALVGLNLGWTLCESGELDRAQDHAMEALGYFSGCENRWREIECFRLIGDINARCEDYANAERCYGIALTYAEQIDCAPEARATRERIAALARAKSRAARRLAPPRLAVDPPAVPPDGDAGGGTSPTAGLS